MDYDVTIIGGGPGGYVAAIRAAQLGHKVAVVEESHLGGICLNWGCIPTKSLLYNAHVLDLIKNSKKYGISIPSYTVDWKKVIKRSRDVSNRLSKGIEFLMKKNKITYLPHRGKLIDKNTICLSNKKNITSKFIILATGGRPREIPGIKFDGKIVISSKEAMVLDKIPKNEEYQYTVDRTPVLPQILPAVPRKENIVKEDLNTNSEDTLNKQILSEYNELIRSKIKQYAIRNYPTKSIKRGQEGTVFLKFILDENGYLTDIKIGDKTDASIALINAAKDSIEKNSPYKFDQKLKKKNEFSIVIVYKID